MDATFTKAEPSPPFAIILDELLSGMVVPFLGAGASATAEADSDGLPTASDLAQTLAADAGLDDGYGPDRLDLAKVSSYFVDRSNRGALRRRLRRIFLGSTAPCNDLHRFLAHVANNMTIVTTNYDSYLEQAFEEIGKPYDLIIYPSDSEDYANAVLWWRHDAAEPEKIRPNQLDIDEIRRTNVIYKMHGSVGRTSDRWDSFVITEEDYIKLLSRVNLVVPAAFRHHFSERSFLFLGYGLKDWNTRVLLKQVSQPGVTSWAIMRAPSRFERTLWERRQVSIFDLSLKEFVRTMIATLERRTNGPDVPA